MGVLIQAKTLTLYKTKLIFKFVILYIKTKNHEKRYYLEIVENSKTIPL